MSRVNFDFFEKNFDSGFYGGFVIFFASFC